MSDNAKRRLTLKAKAKDLQILEVLNGISSYAPVNADVKLTALNSLKSSMESRQTDELQSKAAALGTRDDAVAEEKLFHQRMLAAVDAVKSQYGEDSNEYQALGRKKKSEHKSPKRKTKTENK